MDTMNPINNNDSDEFFYKNLKSFNKFNEFLNLSHYEEVPSSWYVIITDVKNSTQAIMNGQYKDVNIIGAACIAAVENNLDLNICPSVFGGDGCSILVPEKYIEKVKKSLSEVRNSAKIKYNLDLRVAIVPIKELNKLGQIIKVAKYNLNNVKSIAKFAGGGLSFADKLIKSNNKYELPFVCTEFSSFKNLSCRWEEVPSHNGKILSLIIQAKNFNIYRNVLNELNNILGDSEYDINPIKTDFMKYKSIKQMIKDEKNFEKSIFSFKNFARIIEIIMCYYLFQVFRNYLPRFLTKYIKAMESHSDFRKFDDTLKMVIDCSEEQISQIENLCFSLYNDKKINYGLNVSNSSLMTCLVNNLNNGGHIHFVDGSNGGYSLAAKNMKKQESL